MDAATPMDARPRPIERVRERVSAADLAAVRRVRRGAHRVRPDPAARASASATGPRREMVPARLGILHPTGYPLYSLVGTLFSLIPIESVAYRANLLSAVAAAAAVGVMVLIAVRLGVRPVIAFAAALALAFTGTIWQEATFSEMNGLHLFLVALLLHRALVWREERRDRDLLLGALLGGLCVANHGLAITVVPIVVLFVLADARREIRRAAGPAGQGRGGLRARAPPLPLAALARPCRTGRGLQPVPDPRRAVRPHQRRAVPRRHALRLDRQRPGRLGGSAAGRGPGARAVEPGLRRPRRLRDRRSSC